MLNWGTALKVIKQQDGSTGITAYLETGDLSDRVGIFEHFRQHLWRNALRITGNQSDADEVLQIACEQLLETPQEKLEAVKNIEAWLYVLVSNCAKRYIRTEVRLRDRHKRAAEHTDRIIKEKEADRERYEEGASLIAEVRGALDELPEMYQKPIYLFYIEGLAWKDVANSMGLKEEAVRKRAQRGIVKIRKMIVRSGQGVSLLLLGSIFNNLRASELIGEAVWSEASAISIAASTAKVSTAKVIMGSIWFQAAACLVATTALVMAFSTGEDRSHYSFDENMPLSAENSLQYSFEDDKPSKRIAHDDNALQRTAGWRRLTPSDFHSFNGVSTRRNNDDTFTYIVDSRSAILSDISLLYPKLDYSDPAGHRIRFSYQITEVYGQQAAKRRSGDLDRARFGFAVNYGGVQSDGLSYERGMSRSDLGMVLPETGSMAGDIILEINPVQNGKYMQLKKYRVLSNGRQIDCGSTSVAGPGQSGFAFYYALAFVSGVQLEITDIQVSELHPSLSRKPRVIQE